MGNYSALNALILYTLTPKLILANITIITSLKTT